MTQIVVGIGSNTEREKNICVALDKLSENFEGLIISPVYESAASNVSQSTEIALLYYNLVAAFESSESVENIKSILQSIENEQGRQRAVPVVTLDLDLLLYGDWVGELEGNAVPHHDITQCEYVLRPLADLFPDQLHPVYLKSYADLWSDFDGEKKIQSVEFVWNDCVISNANFLPPF